jgi:aconitate hydratase
MRTDLYHTQANLTVNSNQYTYYSFEKLASAGLLANNRLPCTIRILLEAVLRKYDGSERCRQDIQNLAGWEPRSTRRPVIPFYTGRVIMQDFSGVPVLVDLAAMRSAMARLGGDPASINPVVPVDVVIDHSIQVDYFGRPDSIQRNAEIEFERNRERYEFLHWGQKAFDNFRVVPPSTGIVHQVNLEYLAQVVLKQERDNKIEVYPDTVVGTDSHTTMINGLGVVGWGVGGIEAVAAMMGEPIEMPAPDVIGVRLSGSLPEGVTPTDLTLTITQLLRKKGVVEKFVEFFGQGLSSLPVTERAMVSNMSPENGATMMYFPIDELTLDYLRQSGRSEEQIQLVEAYYRAQGLFRSASTPDPEFTDVVEVDLSTVEPSMAGPKRPQDRILLSQVKPTFEKTLTAPRTERGYALSLDKVNETVAVKTDGTTEKMGHGAVVIAAITSCTNTSNPFVMIGAGLVAKKAVEKGLKPHTYVKTSLAPGSRVVTDYLMRANLLEPLAELGFNIVGYGCTTCIGNSGPLPQPVADAVNSAGLVAAAVLSGNRNFEGRVHPNVQANFLASPPLVIAYALAGSVDIDLTREPLGTGKDGLPVYLKDIWPTTKEIEDTIARSITPEMFRERYANVFTGNEAWNRIQGDNSDLYPWDSKSTYIQEPPYFTGELDTSPKDVQGARVLALLGDSITTDHISPAGSISATGDAGKYLISLGVQPKDFNSFGSRRGNDRVMIRGTFGNIRIKNLLLPGVEGSFTLHLPDNRQMTIYEAAMRYKADNVPLIVIAGKEYGTGSSRDWAAKGALLLGVRAVIAESFERIHRSNLAEMGVVPLQFLPGENVASLGLDGHEVYSIEGIGPDIQPNAKVTVHARRPDGTDISFTTIARLDTQAEIEYYRQGGILNSIIHNRLHP